MRAIHFAAYRGDIVTLRSHLSDGASPDEKTSAGAGVGFAHGCAGKTPLHCVCCFDTDEEISKMLGLMGTSLALRDYAACCRALVAAGADVNAVDDGLESPLEYAAELGCAAMVKKLISAGAIYLDDALRLAVSRGRLRNCALLIRAGAELPDKEKTRGFLEVYASNWDDPCRVLITRARTYIERISATIGGFQAYEREHCRRLTTVFANKFPALPIEVISHIVLLWAHCGDYDYEDYLRVECNRVAALRRLRGGPRTE